MTTEKFWLCISQKCNNKCVFCHDVDNQRGGEFFSFDKLSKEIEAAKKSGATRLILSGGEASIHPDFIKIIAYAKQAGFSEIQTITNGRLFYYPEFARQAVEAGLSEVTFSLHGHEPSLHDSLTGVSGSFKQAITGLHNVIAYSELIVNIDIVLNKKNYQHIYEMIKYFSEKFGIFEYDLLQLVPFGRAWENRAELFYDPAAASPYLRQVFDLAKKDKRFHIWTNRFSAPYLEDFEFLIQPPQKFNDEIRGRQDIFSNYLNSDIMMPCRDSERCDYCNLNDYCAKLIELKEILNHDTSGFVRLLNNWTKEPACLSLNEKKMTRPDFIRDNNIEINKFTDYYLTNLYRVKSLRCQTCTQYEKCSGANIEKIKELGFKILKPI